MNALLFIYCLFSLVFVLLRPLLLLVFYHNRCHFKSKVIHRVAEAVRRLRYPAGTPLRLPESNAETFCTI